MRSLALAILALAGVTELVSSQAHADPVAFVVNEDAASISAVDVNAAALINHFSTQGTNPSSSGLNPQEAVFDPRSGRLFVAADNRLMGFNGRLADGSDRSQTPAQ